MAGNRSPIRSFSLHSVRARIAVRLFLLFLLRLRLLLLLLLSASQHRLRASNLALSLTLSSWEYNMTDGHNRTNTVGHRAVRGRRMPPDSGCCSALRARLTCVCVARFRGVLPRYGECERNHLRHPRFDSGLQALTRRVSTCLYARRLAGLVWRGVSSSPPRSSLAPYRRPSFPLLHTQHNTSRTGGGKRDTCLALLSKRPIRTAGANHRAPPVGRRVESLAERAILRRVQIWPSPASPD